MELDPIAARLDALLHWVGSKVGDQVCITVEDTDYGRMVELEPTAASALTVSWIEIGSEVILQAGHNGGRWELLREPRDIDFLEDVVRSVVAGRVAEVFGTGRSRVEVVLSDGSVAAETGSAMGRGCLPLPGWKRRGRRVEYVPYSG